MLNFTINEDRCIQCGKCVTECPPHCIVMEHGKFLAIAGTIRTGTFDFLSIYFIFLPTEMLDNSLSLAPEGR